MYTYNFRDELKEAFQEIISTMTSDQVMFPATIVFISIFLLGIIGGLIYKIVSRNKKQKNNLCFMGGIFLFSQLNKIFILFSCLCARSTPSPVFSIYFGVLSSTLQNRSENDTIDKKPFRRD